MAEFEIEIGKITKLASELDGFSGVLRQQKGRVESVARQLQFKGDYRGVDIALGKIAANVSRQQTQMKQYGGMLGNIAAKYKNTESSIVAKVTPAMQIQNALTNAWNLFIPGISQFGAIGSAISTILKFGGNSIDGISSKDILSLLKGVDGLAGKIAGMAAKEAKDRNWTDFLFGEMSKSMWEKLNVKPDASIGTKWAAYVKDKYGLKNFKPQEVNGKITTASKVQVATKYIGAALAFGVTALDNKSEQGGVMNGRAWEETIVETGATLVEGAIIGGAITAAIGSAPAVAVGLATVGVTWAVDMGYRAISGSKNGLIEDVSDLVCDHVIEPVGKAVSNWGKSVCDKVTNFFSGGNKRAAYSGGW